MINSNILTPNIRSNLHQISPGLRQNSSIICSIYSKDNTEISSSLIILIMIETIVDIVLGPDCSDVFVKLLQTHISEAGAGSYIDQVIHIHDEMSP